MANHKSLSEEHKKKLSLLRKGVPRTEEDKRKIRLGRQNSIKCQIRMERSRLRKKQKQQAKNERIRQIEARKLQKIAIRIYYNSLKVGPTFTHTRDGLRKISEANKGRIPWNKGIIAWNRNKPWPVKVKENISKGMIQMWQRRKSKQTASLFIKI